MDEIWKDIHFIESNGIEYDFTGLYQISNLGRVKSIGKKRSGNNINGKILKQTKNKQGYFCVTLCKNTVHRNFFVHRLVAHMFVLNPKNKPYVDHIIPVSNGGSNNAKNLRWVTTIENCNNKITRNNNSISKIGKPNYGSMIKIFCITTGEIFKSITEASKKYNIDQSSITKCCKGKRKTAGGFEWKYVEDDNDELL